MSKAMTKLVFIAWQRRADQIELAMANDLLYKASLHLGVSPQNKRGSLLHKIQLIGNIQQAAAASSTGPPTRKRRASMNQLYFSGFSRHRIEEHYEHTVQISVPRPGGDTNRQNDQNESLPRIDALEERATS
jgi:hypothetical protein